MGYDPIMQMMLIACIIAVSIAFLYYVFYWWLVRKTKYLPTRLDDIGWKKADYWWITIGAFGFVIQSIQAGTAINQSTINMEESIGRLTSQNLNMAAARLSDPPICLPPSANNHVTALSKELASACEEFRKIRPDEPTKTQIDLKIVRYFTDENKGIIRFNNPLIKERFDDLIQDHAKYVIQSDSIEKARSDFRHFEKIFDIIKYAASILLGAAIALRLAKVTGEIRLKTDPIKEQPPTDIALKRPEKEQIQFD
ncbi:hypothetical protein HDC30_000561 [Pseudomonas sp. JAI115]|uniref:hypothetical protein n=1 Tax=Pseudomonas sp. JAI115 TaxID=2723061 RepID=UPI001612BCBC|nr:hypothetical protein [Pseudomonas sp. JAI115]MBB6153367.1 hypothetical protein [Pseudomonas sp. JAI115]